MTIDPRNLPFQNQPPYFQETQQRPQVGARARPQAEAPDPSLELKAESILLQEFSYAGASVYQAREDSGALINIYLLATGALATGLGVLVNAYSGATRPTVSIIATAALAIFAVLSFAFFARLLDLEQEYREGLLTMGVIKEYYIQRLRRAAPEIELAFRWRLRRRLGGATLVGGAPLLAWTIALLSGLSVAGAVGEGRQLFGILTNTYIAYAPEPAPGLRAPFFWELLAGVVAFAAHLAYYLLVARRRLRRAELDGVAHAERIERELMARR